MDGHTVITRFRDGYYQVLYLLDGKPLHAKAYPLGNGPLDSMQYALMDWAQDGVHHVDEYTVPLA